MDRRAAAFHVAKWMFFMEKVHAEVCLYGDEWIVEILEGKTLPEAYCGVRISRVRY